MVVEWRAPRCRGNFTRTSTGTLLTDRTFTGQKQDRVPSGRGLMYYNARYYDPALGLFLSPDTIVPDAGQIIDYHRYGYVRNSPLRYTDPTGHFSEDQLREWFGDDWEAYLGADWSAIFLEAVFGDAILYGSSGDGNPLLAVMVKGADGALAFWSVNQRETLDINSTLKNSSTQGLYRAQNRLHKDTHHGLQSNWLNPQNAAWTDAHVYNRVAGFGDPGNMSSYALPLDWYAGPGQHVSIRGKFVGIELGLSELIEVTVLTRTIAREGVEKAVGGPFAALALAVDVALSLRFETEYRVSDGNATLPVVPAPTPMGR
jgi:RHS repeat-associated protein